ncbi:MAG: sugar ABC transporter substrate-binding protein [Clostridiales bacterium]|nr:sugar ABC transporter substrate-binding protein [Clostridiales bacterium]
MLKQKLNARILAVTMVLLILASTLLGCGRGNISKTSTTADEQKPVTLKFWTISLQPTFTDFFNGLIAQYQKEHKNVTIQWTDLPYDAIQSKLITSAAGGTSPDVVNLNSSMALMLAGKNALVDLNKEATDAQKSIYIPSLYNSTKLGNSVYAFPWYGAPTVMIYNKDLFQKAGIQNPPTTFDEMFDVAKTMKDKTGAYLYIPGNITQILFEEGIQLINNDKTKATFNIPETLALLQKYKKAVDDGILPKDGWGVWDKMLKQFSTGKLAIINSGTQSIKRIKDEAPNIYKNVEVTQPMVGKAGISLNPLMNIVVPAASKNHKSAIDFANYITNDANQLAFCKKVAIFPSTKKASEDSFFKSDTSTIEKKAISIAADVLPKTADFTLGLAEGSNIFTEVNKVYEASILGNTDLQQALNSSEKKVNEILANKKD